MKRVSFLSLTLLLGTGLVACNPTSETTTTTSTATTTTASSVATASAPAATSSSASATVVASGDATQEAVVTATATTSIIGDFVRAVGGDRVKVQVLVPAGSDAHTFSPSPESVRTLAGSGVLFANGAGLEGWLPDAVAAAPDVPTVLLAEALALHKADEGGHDHGAEGHSEEAHMKEASGTATDHEHDHDHEEASGAVAEADHDHADEHDHEHGDEYAGHNHGEFDPHAWWDVELASGYLDGIAAKLSELDPAGADTYRQNAEAYAAELRTIDEYGKKQFAAIPPEQRVVVTAHDALNYFAERYGLEVVGAVIPGLSTEREPSAQELAALADTMREHGVRVILTENVTSDRLAQALAKETGAVVAPPVYTDALGPAGSPGETFTGAFRHNIDSIVSSIQQAAAAKP